MKVGSICHCALAMLGVIVVLSAGEAQAAGAPRFFRAKPSGITCAALRLGSGAATMRCDLPGAGRRAAFLHTRGKGEIARVPSLLHPRRRPLVLRVGSSRTFGPFSCASRPRTVTCRASGGHGFTVGRAFQLVF